MNQRVSILLLGIIAIIMLTAIDAARAQQFAPASGIWLHPKCQKLPTDQLGPFVRLGDGSVLAVTDNRARISSDDGKTWQARPMIKDSERFHDVRGGALFRTADGVIVRAFVNMKEKVFKWDYDGIGPLPECQLPVYIVRSPDDGETWLEPEKLLDGWCGYVHNIIQTSSGRLVLVCQVAVPDPGHHVSMTYVSDDDGKSWTRSNLIDMGGRGDHAGGIEPAIVELKDGRLWLLIRTYRGRFWEAFSSDEGLTWEDLRPSKIEASGSPGVLLRLKSGRIILAWNRFAEGRPRKISRREELSIAFSEDEGSTWSEPVVIARNRTPEGESPVKYRLSYPDVYEHQPGELWVTTGQGLLRVKLHESDFAPAS